MMKSNVQNFRERLLLSSNRNPILPHVPTRIVGRPEQGPLMLERLILSGLDKSGSWIINAIEVDGVSQLRVKNLSGDLFSSQGVVTGGKRAFSYLSFHGLNVIEIESEVAVTVTYVGSNPLGMPFFAAIVGDTPPQRPTILPIATKNKLLPTITTTVTAVLDQCLEISMLEIEDTGTNGGAADWIVNDIRINGTSQFLQSGDVPGDMFSHRAIDTFVKFYPPGTRIELIVTYIGLNESGCCFAARLLGTVVRDDLQQPPPDVHVNIRTSGEDFVAEVTARCDWRTPYMQPGT